MTSGLFTEYDPGTVLAGELPRPTNPVSLARFAGGRSDAAFVWGRHILLPGGVI